LPTYAWREKVLSNVVVASVQPGPSRPSGQVAADARAGVTAQISDTSATVAAPLVNARIWTLPPAPQGLVRPAD
jgi:hypothetical protein